MTSLWYTSTILGVDAAGGSPVSLVLVGSHSLVTVSLFSSEGELLGAKQYVGAPRPVPLRIDDVFAELGAAPRANCRIELYPTNGPYTAHVTAYATLLDPRTGDATLLPAVEVPSSFPFYPAEVALPGGLPLGLKRPSQLNYVPPASSFRMGSPEGEPERDADETEHAVAMTKLWLIGTTEVTEHQWNAVMGLPGGTEKPVVNISWEEISGPGGFLQRLNDYLRATGQTSVGLVRLPTEAEWEFSARDDGFPMPCLGTGSPCQCPAADRLFWWCGNSPGGPSPVATKLDVVAPPYDMLGNAWEWVSDWYAPFTAASQTDPKGPASGTERVIRGGGWNSELKLCRPANRFKYPPDARYDYVGFRVAASKD